MKRFLAVSLVVASALLLVVKVLPANGIQAPRRAVHSVRAVDLGHKVEVVGRLDQPLGTLVTVRGEMVEAEFGRTRKAVDPKEHVRVRKIGNRILDEPVVVWLGGSGDWAGGKVPMPGTPLELIGYETGGFSGIAPAEDEWDRDPRNKRGSAIPADRGYHFAVVFAVLQYKVLPRK